MWRLPPELSLKESYIENCQNYVAILKNESLSDDIAFKTLITNGVFRKRSLWTEKNKKLSQDTR